MNSGIEISLNNMDQNINIKSGTYHNSNGYNVPRVTEILSTMIHSDNLMYWANSLGFKGKSYKSVLNLAADIGSSAHSAIQKFLEDKIQTYSNIPFLGFMLWYNIVTKDKGIAVDVVYVEHTLVCEWFGGTLDCLMRIGNSVYLIDFKTSNHVTFKYFLQLAAYRFMLRTVEGIEIDGVIVLQLDKEEPGFNEYLLNFNIEEHLAFINHCETTFLSLVFGFYNIKKAEEMYKNIFHNK